MSDDAARLNAIIDGRIHTALPPRTIGRAVGTVAAVIPSLRKVTVLLDGSTTPVSARYPALPDLRLAAGMDVALDRARDGWLMVTAVLAPVPYPLTLLAAPVLVTMLTPPQLTASTDDWNPAGGSAAYLWRVSFSAAWNLTGIAAGQDGERHELVNISAFTGTLLHDSTSVAVNRFYCSGSGSFSLVTNGSAVVTYDATSARWRVR